MYAEPLAHDEQGGAILTPFWSDGRRHSRSQLPSINTSHDGDNNGEITISGLPDDVDVDQQISQKLLDVEQSQHVKAASFPEPPVSPFFSYSQENISEADLSMSPAAMFLSSFSPRAEQNVLPDDEGQVVCGYTLGPIIGYGAFSTIRRASSPQGGTVAVKIVRRTDINKQQDPERAKQHLDHERQVWSSLNHEHILPLFSSLHTPYADFFVTLYCPAGSLFDILKRDGRPALPQDDAGMMFRQVVRGLRYLHEVAGIVHGDMKLENVLVDEMGVCRIGDFGMARKIGSSDDSHSPSPPPECDQENTNEPMHARIRHHSTMSSAERLQNKHGTLLPIHLSLIRHHSGPRHRNSSPLPSSSEIPHVFPDPTFQPGSLPYAAPELLLPQNTSYTRPNPAQDIWALGVMLYTLLTGRLPFADSFEPRLQMKILHGVYDVPEGIGRGAERVLKGCLERSVAERWTIAMVDEVAWGVGWGSDGDAVPSPEQACRPLREQIDTEKPSSAPCSRPSTSRSTSAVRSTSRSASRSAAHPYQTPHYHTHHHHPTLPSFSALNDSILRSASSCSSSSSSSVPSESALHFSSDSFEYDDAGDRFERGRALRPHSHLATLQSSSRSPSPLDVPPTPTDASLHPEGNRGRKVSPRHLETSPSNHPFFKRDSQITSSPLDTVEEYSAAHDARWGLSPDSTQSSLGRERSPRSLSHDDTSSRARDVRSPYHEERVKIRPGSMPPAPFPGFPWRMDLPPPDRSEDSSTATPKAIQSSSIRSRSVGFDIFDRRYSPAFKT
ncbi:unnamed protein product [Somion occarium]|uniref:Protein kinase domain-containing protein n=2 Tax=Somion occarium TaxID=3059160 RepID=A0ABP1E167_9APHY